MAQKYLPGILAVWCNTGVEGRVTEQFAHQTIQDMAINIYEATPRYGIDFWKLVKEHGWPGTRLKGGNRTPRCCIELKDRPATDAYKIFGTKVIMTGVRAEESRNRWLVMKRNQNKAHAQGINGDLEGRSAGLRYTLKDGTEKLNPIIDWTQDEVFRYCEDNNIPMHPIYLQSHDYRVGCIPCTSYLSWKETLSETDPKMLRFILKEKENQLQITDLCRWAGVRE
jgi:phosphoadenosine phosphosulfate reductase